MDWQILINSVFAYGEKYKVNKLGEMLNAYEKNYFP